MSRITESSPTAWESAVARCAERNGVIELSFDPPAGAASHESAAPEAEAEARRSERVRLLDRQEGHWIVDRPIGWQCGRQFAPGARLVGLLHSDRHRFRFRTRVLDVSRFRLNERRWISALRLVEPTDVALAQRRRFVRVETLDRDLPPARLWPLLDVASVVAFEDAIRAVHQGQRKQVRVDALRPPRLGRQLTAAVRDISGNGVGLIVEAGAAPVLRDHERFFLELILPDLSYLLLATGRRVRLEPVSPERLLAAFSFDFEHNPPHEPFINDAICHFAAEQQRRMLKRQR